MNTINTMDIKLPNETIKTIDDLKEFLKPYAKLVKYKVVNILIKNKKLKLPALNYVEISRIFDTDSKSIKIIEYKALRSLERLFKKKKIGKYFEID